MAKVLKCADLLKGLAYSQSIYHKYVALLKVTYYWRKKTTLDWQRKISQLQSVYSHRTVFPYPRAGVYTEPQSLLLFCSQQASPVKSSALEVNGGQEEQHACVIRLLPPQLHTMTLGGLKVAWLILPVCEFSQPLEGKHTFGRFWSTITAQGRGGGNNMLDMMKEKKADKWKQ